jgi:hypothetical protein
MPPPDPAERSCIFDTAPDAGMGMGATCLEYRGDFVRETCPAGAGYVEIEACPMDGVLGTCVTRIESSRGYSETTTLVYEEAALAANEDECVTGGGDWELATPSGP